MILLIVKETKLLQISERVRELNAHKGLLGSQLNTSLESTLSSEERSTLEEIEVITLGSL